MSAEWIAAIAGGGTILGYILKGLFDTVMGRDEQSAKVDRKRTETETDAVKAYREMAVSADKARNEMQKELVGVRRELGEAIQKNAELEQRIQHLEKKVNTLCGKTGGRPKDE